MSSSTAKSNDNKITKLKGTAARGRGRPSSNSEAKNKNDSHQGTANRVKNERPTEAPVSKFDDLIMHGVKPWDVDADDFYDSLLEARREFDEWLDKNSSPAPKESPVENSNPYNNYEAREEIYPLCQDEDYEINPCQGEDSDIGLYENIDYDAYQDEDSDY